MQGYNVLMIYNKNMDRLLMCKRLKAPYKGLSNLVGGKIENGETGIEAAYRELLEATNIAKADIILHHLMDFNYYLQNCYVEVYVGKLKRDVSVAGDENILYWSDLDNNFFDISLYAGEGNIGHMIEHVNYFKDKLFSGEASLAQYRFIGMDLILIAAFLEEGNGTLAITIKLLD